MITRSLSLPGRTLIQSRTLLNIISSYRITSRQFNTTGNGFQQSNETPLKKKILESKKKLINEQKWLETKLKLSSFKKMTKSFRDQSKYHIDNMKKSIRQANEKIAAQEKEQQDSRLNYNEDVNTHEKIKDLPSERELNRKKWSRKLEFYLDSLQETLFTATRALNDVTGYSSIQKLRNSILIMEQKLDTIKKEVKVCKSEYADAIERRTQSQKELNELLQRKTSWSPTDLERFTQLYKDDSSNSKRESKLKEKVKDIELKEEQLNEELYRAILTRYHEEQIWSDKIRRTSTWGTFLLMGMNIFLFLILQLLLEPWKRRRLTRSFEDKVKIALDKYSLEHNLKLAEMISENANIKARSDDIKKGILAELEEEDSTSTVNSEESQLIPSPIKEEPIGDTGLLVAGARSANERIRISFHILLNWFSQLARKLKRLPFFDLQKSTEFTTLEVYIYSSIVLSLGTFVARI
ncbi:She9p NDAI_0A04300 [Naumovozyma dairenensis CBS 421]|uniref:Sensitive to high expression protein 9, mitochondrial n=1 Tax=Naumovozyma dairenensis (strain ATCC 10597 / BCRC 20456 / CBS 421 / NBRC 0211 / NRRL Y-12639) TaxID=1071378 RepID=G0W449_NAUDC|nr:hypothetical protein NDAI_0A04300 [Naumovozyma dairenensis CBS 421]CCD22587.1 hypothetical protein NDAI_0A04300 [Naumovozyma dairenensis CBS 421]